jgi:hypothetical protein
MTVRQELTSERISAVAATVRRRPIDQADVETAEPVPIHVVRTVRRMEGRAHSALSVFGAARPIGGRP